MRVALALSLLLALPALAGCLGGEAPTAPVEPAAASTLAPGLVLHNATGLVDEALALTDPLLAPLLNATAAWLSVDGRDGREPTVGVDSKGAIYYAARDYSGGNTPPVSSTQTPIMKSEDGGLTWADVSPTLPTGDREPPRSGDPMVWVDPWTDRVFQIELYDLVCNWLVYSDDGGASWTGNAKACGPLVVDHQTIGAGPSRGTPTVGYPNVVYVCVNQIADSHCARSLDGGLTFSTFSVVYNGLVAEECQGAGGLHGHVLVDATGAVYLPREFCGKPYVAVSQDDGMTWTLKDVGGGMGAIGQDPNMAFDAEGNVYYLWVADDQLLYLTWSADQGATWSEPVRVSAPGVSAVNLPSITAGDAGHVGIAYVGAQGTASPPEDEAWENVTWDAYVGVAYDATSAAPTFATQRANPDGDPVYRGDCTGRRCGLLREFIDASVAPDGTFYVAFIDGCVEECVGKAEDFGEGNANLAYVVHVEGIALRTLAAPEPDAARGLPGLAPLLR